MKTSSHLWQYLPEFFLELKRFQIKIVEEIKALILRSVTFSRKLCRLWDNLKETGGARVLADNMTQARFMLHE